MLELQQAELPEAIYQDSFRICNLLQGSLKQINLKSDSNIFYVLQKVERMVNTLFPLMKQNCPRTAEKISTRCLFDKITSVK